MAPRRLSTEQQRAIQAAVATFAGQRAIVFLYTGDAEIERIANDIAATLIAAVWKVTIRPGMTFGGSIAGIDVAVRTGADQKVEAAAPALANALDKEGLAVTATRQRQAADADTNNTITITVGKKP